MIRELEIKYSIEGNDYAELACLNQKCRANRIYCHQCVKNFGNVEGQKNLKEQIEQIEKDSESQISSLRLMVNKILQLFKELNLKLKYELSMKNLSQLNTKQLEQVLNQVIKYEEIKTDLFQEVKTFSDSMTAKLKRNIIELKVDELKQSELNQQEQVEVEQLYQKGFKLFFIIKQNYLYITTIIIMKKLQKYQTLHYSLILNISIQYIQKLIVQSNHYGYD